MHGSQKKKKSFEVNLIRRPRGDWEALCERTNLYSTKQLKTTGWSRKSLLYKPCIKMISVNLNGKIKLLCRNY